jgi:Na+/H+ antiporter NhaA
MATIGLVLSVISIIPCCCGPFGIAGLIVSILALGQAKKLPNEEGKEKAIAGIILSGIGLAMSLGISLMSMANNSRFMFNSHHW